MRPTRPALVALVTAAALLGPVPPAAEAAPPGFTDTLVGTTNRPTAVEPLLDGRVAVLEKGTGRIRLIDSDAGTVLAAPAVDLDVCAGGERGLLGFTIDPLFARNGRVYVYYTRFAPGFPGGCVNRVSAFTMTGDTIDTGSEQVLIDNISSVGGNHNAGDVEIGNDGFLYIATGDAGTDPRGDSGSAGRNDAAQDLSLLNGKILRLDRFSGAPAPGNPLAGAGTVACGSRGNTASTPATSCRELFAWGLRNPYRFAFDPNTSDTRFFINDVGQGTQEEVNDGLRGADYGWNAREGDCPQGQVSPCAGPPPQFTDPILSYGRSLGRFITAGAFVPDGVWPAEYDGAYLFADGGSGRVWLRTASGVVDWDAPFAEGKFGITDMAFVTELAGVALYYTQDGSNVVRRIRFDAPGATSVGPSAYQPLPEPRRAFDSREQNPAVPIRGGFTRLIDLGAPKGAVAAIVNITMVEPAGEVFATAWEPRTARPRTSNVNALNGEIVGNTSVVPVDATGRMVLYVRTTTDVVIDVSGFFVDAPGPTAPGRFRGLDPLRLIDTRDPSTPSNTYTQTIAVGDPNPTLPSPFRRLSVPVAGRVGVPASGVSAVVMIATGLNEPEASSGWVRVTPGGRPGVTASLNTNPGLDHRNNLVVVALGADGSVDIDLLNTGAVVLDVVGWFTDDSRPVSGAGRFQLIEPHREIDTRIVLGAPTFGDATTVVLDPVSVPRSASGVAQNLTVAPSTAAGYFTAHPNAARPVVSNLNTTAGGQVRGAAAFTKLSDGSERLFSLRAAELVVDVFGYFL
ncbi:MAG: hypothetical protein HKN44_00050 [Ilumatobacter sp.]|nr:hypothetical protein [Ilumatobacter sp.]